LTWVEVRIVFTPALRDSVFLSGGSDWQNTGKRAWAKLADVVREDWLYAPPVGDPLGCFGFNAYTGKAPGRVGESGGKPGVGIGIFPVTDFSLSP
jgi:hypothetical protein